MVGTGAVVFTDNGRRAELGRACIHPDYRGLRNGNGKGAFSELIAERITHALEQGAQIVHSTGVTSHPKTQAGLEENECRALALEQGKYAVLYDPENGQRETSLEMVSLASPVLKRRGLVTIPEDAITLVEYIIGSANAPIEIRTPSGVYHGAAITASYDPISQHTLFFVVPGNKPLTEILTRINSAVAKDTYVQVKISAVEGVAAPIHHALAELGFKATGFLPGWIKRGPFIDDALVMERTNVGLDAGKIHLLGSARELARKAGYNIVQYANGTKPELSRA
ncbi:hypothetical protein COV18_01335 [Candidatus Woesearchaeota archaeon CG10_big_fil_rev_8_21_14_0_10_37_12]|nr:MAG: hypothetical protein COV18_01335 [Candidatus Woesearchaeota archaeon CG10_big_fil_rev_8_21_14_0_10_37_12]